MMQWHHYPAAPTSTGFTASSDPACGCTMDCRHPSLAVYHDGLLPPQL